MGNDCLIRRGLTGQPDFLIPPKAWLSSIRWRVAVRGAQLIAGGVMSSTGIKGAFKGLSRLVLFTMLLPLFLHNILEALSCSLRAWRLRLWARQVSMEPFLM